MRVQLLLGDCLDRLKELPSGSVGVLCGDPPYGLSFMGRDWDTFGRQIPHKARVADPKWAKKRGGFQPGDSPEYQEFSQTWLMEAFRVLAPGGRVKVFGGTRVFHRLAVAMGQAGFVDIRLDSWSYGSGFPKSHNVAVYMDRMLTEGKSREVRRGQSPKRIREPEQGPQGHEAGGPCVARVGHSSQAGLGVRAGGPEAG